MKPYVHYLFMALALSILAPACQPAETGQEETIDIAPAALGAPAFWQNLTAFTTDTLTNTDNATYSLGAYNRPVSIEVQVAADSLSGGTAGTATLQQSINGSDWTDLSAVTINGVTTRGRCTADVLGGTLRVYAASTGTQSTALRMDAIIAESQPAQ